MAQATLVHFYQIRTFLLELLYITHQGLVNLNYGHMMLPSCKRNWDTESWAMLDSLGPQREQKFQRQEGDCLGKVTAVGRICCVPDCLDPELSGGHPATSHPVNIPWLLLVSPAAFCVISKTKQNKWLKPSKTENTHRSRFPRGAGAREGAESFHTIT